MKLLWTEREIDAPAAAVWGVFTDLALWPQWGPSVMRAELANDRLEAGATGTVTTALGFDVGFEVTDFDDGRSWAWNVAGIPATHHRVAPLGDTRCRAGFGVPWVAAPYLAICQIALGRIDRLAVDAADL